MKTNWKKVKLGEICTVARGGSPRPISSFITEKENGLNWIKIGDAEPGSMYITSTKEKIKPEGLKKTRQVFEGDLILSNSMSFGRPYILNIDGCIHDGWLLIRDKENNFDRRYLYYFLSSSTAYSQMKKMAVGGVVNNLNSTLVKDVEVILPPLDIQKKIADALDKVDEIRRKRQEFLSKLDEFVKSTFIEWFENEESSEWRTFKIEELAKPEKGAMRTGPFGSNLLHSEFVDEGISVLGIDNAVENRFQWGKERYITEEKYKELVNYRVYPRDVIITIMGTTGRSAVVPEDIPLTINTKHLAAISLDPDKCNPYYLSYAIHSSPNILKQIQLRNRGAIMSGLNLTIIKGLELRLPPVELQNSFEELIKKIWKLEDDLVDQDNENNLFNSLMQKAFKGELEFN